MEAPYEYELTPTEQEHAWSHPQFGDWILTLTFAGPVPPLGGVECTELRIRPAGAPTALKAGALRAINLGSIIGAEKDALAAQFSAPIQREVSSALSLDAETGQVLAAGRSGEPAIAEMLERARDSAGSLVAHIRSPRREPGRPARLTSGHFEEVARVYRKANRGLGSAPTRAVADHFHRPYSVAAKWVARARALYGDAMGPYHQGRPRSGS